uniref:Uncharacterized protein n=1 Tax=Arundo donax TaxID=35708 RepID=A0A0A9DHB7_ARUDO
MLSCERSPRCNETSDVCLGTFLGGCGVGYLCTER